jgi:hypothetical protein
VFQLQLWIIRLQLWMGGIWRTLTSGRVNADPFDHLHWDRGTRRWRSHDEENRHTAA